MALASIDAIDVMADPEMIEEKSRAMLYVGLDTAGPAITAGSMLLLYEVAIALFIGLGPLFILCLLFERPNPCSNGGCSTASERYSRWRYWPP